MNKERIIVGFLLTLISILTTVDVVEDVMDGTRLEHLILDILIGVSTFVAAGFLIKQLAKDQKKINLLENERKHLLDIADQLKHKSKALVEGLSLQIDREFDSWNLTPAEREVGLLLLKGLSAQEIADIRGSAEKTIRHQTTSIFKKAGIKSRQELQAYFLEDLLPGIEAHG